MATGHERLERIHAEIDRRVKLVARIQDGGEAGIRLALDHYADHLVEWVRDFCWTYDPRNPSLNPPLPAYVPMVPAPVQVELLEWLEWLLAERKDGWLPKSRGVGASYVACAFNTHRWLFEDGYSGSLLSMTEEEVDQRNDPDSLFQKLRILLEWTPKWQWPDEFDGVGQDSQHDNHRRLYNPETGATITGKIGRSPGRGGRRRAVFVDEAAHIRNLVEVRRALRENTNTIVEMSTYRGTGEPFYRSCQQGGDLVFLIKWDQIPWYDDEWYKAKKAQYADDPVGFAQEVEADPTESIENVVIPQKWVQAAVDLDVSEVTPRPVIGALDVAGGGKNKNVLIIRRGIRLEAPKVRQDGNTTRTAHWAREEVEDIDAEALYYDATGIGAGVGDTLLVMDETPRVDVVPFVAGGTPSNLKWPNKKRSHERFVNMRAEAWWLFRDRCRKAYERAESIEMHPIAECISLPDDPDLLMQLSQPCYEHTSRGKIKIESKEDMEARGVPSPDHADAAVMTEAHTARPTIDFSPTPQVR